MLRRCGRERDPAKRYVMVDDEAPDPVLRHEQAIWKEVGLTTGRSSAPRG